MRKLLLLLFLTPLISISQNDFRKMNWGDAPSVLSEKYPELGFETEASDGMIAYSHDEYVTGIDTKVTYIFKNNLLFAGFYDFTRNSTSRDAKELIKDFNNISNRLSEKYVVQLRVLRYRFGGNNLC